MRTFFPARNKIVLTFAAIFSMACSEKPESTSFQISPKSKTLNNFSGTCQLPPIAVSVGQLLNASWGENGPGAFPFTQGGPTPAPENVALTLTINFNISDDALTLTSVTGWTPAGDKVYLPAMINRPVRYIPPPGGYSETPEHYLETGCDSLWENSPTSPGAIAIQNEDGSYRAQCASLAMDSIPVVFRQSGNDFTSDMASPDLAIFSDFGKNGWIEPNSGRIVIGSKAYGSVSRGWELAARLQEAGIAKFTASQIPWVNGEFARVNSELVEQQVRKFGATVSNSGSDYTYRTNGYTRDGVWGFSHGHYSIGMPKSGPGRLSSGIAMFRIDGSMSPDRKKINVKNFSYSGPMLVCPANGEECTASPGRSFTGLSCSFTF